MAASKSSISYPSATPAQGIPQFELHPPPAHSPEEEHLLARLTLGEEDAFTRLFEMHGTQMYHTAVRIMRNDDDAQDAVQDAMLNTYRRITAFRGEASLSTWLTRIVINCCLMQLRKRRRHAAVSLDEVGDDRATLLDSLGELSPGLENEIVRRDNQRYLDHAIRQLPKPLRAVVEEYRQNDASMAELAVACGVSVPAAKSRLLRARKALRHAHLLRTSRSAWKNHEEITT